jgi:hypothetical protein
VTLTLQELRSLVDAGHINANEFSLSLTTLNVSALGGQLAGDALTMGPVTIEQSDTDQTVTVTGTASAGCFTGCAMRAVFGISGEGATLIGTATTAPGWSVATAFPVLTHCPVAALRFDTAAFTIDSTAADPVTFAGTLAVSTFLGPLADLLSAPELTGPVHVVNGMPSFVLTTRQTQIDLGFSRPVTMTFEVRADPVTDPAAPTPPSADTTSPAVPATTSDVTTSLVFRATLPFSVRGKQHTLPVTATVVDPATQLTFAVDLTDFTDVVEGGLADLVELAGGTSLGTPPSLPGLTVVDQMTLRDVEIRINPSAQRKLVAVSIEVANSGTWIIMPPDTPGGGLAVDSLVLRVDVDIASGQPSFSIAAEVDAGLGAPLELSAFAPDFTLVGGLSPGTSVRLRDVVTRFAPADVSSFPDVEVAGLAFGIQPGTSYSLDVDVTGDWPVPLGFVDLSVQNLHLSVDYAAGIGVTGSLGGKFTIDGVEIGLSAAHPGTGQWVFTASTAAAGPIDLASMVGGLLPDRISLPDRLSTLQIRGVTVSWDTGPTKHFSCSGETDVTVDVGPMSVVATCTLSIDSLLGADEQRTTSGRLAGTLTMGPMAFTASYAFRPDVQELTATWAGTPVDVTTLATAVGIPLPALDVSLPGLGLHTASFTLDWSQTGRQSVMFEASTAYGRAFFAIARPQPQAGWGVVLGASLDGADSFSQLFSQIGLEVTELDFVRLDGALFLVASDRFPGLQVPGFPVLGTSPTTVNPGVSAGVLLDLGGSDDRPDVAALRTLTAGRQTTLFAEVTLGTSLAALAVTAKLSGGLALTGAGTASLTLSDVALVFKAEPLALTLRGSIGVPVGSATMLATGMLTVADTGSLTAAFDIQGENGQALPLPMGFPGVQLLDLGVELGVTLEPPSVEFGFEGRFVIGRPEARPTGQPVPARPLTGMPPTNEFVMIIGIDGEIPNPVLLSMFLVKVSVGEVVEAFTGQPPTGLPDVLTGISASDLMIYWCDAPLGVQQPDGTWAYAGFGFNCLLDLYGFHAYAALKVSEIGGIRGDACIDPVHLHGVLDLTGTGAGTPSTYTGQETVLPGGPFVHVSTTASPYLAVNWDMVLFNTVSDTLNARLTTSGFTFETAYKVGDVFADNLSCSLKNWTHFELGFSFALRTDVPIGVVGSVDLGPIHLNTTFDGAVVVDVSSGFSIVTTGTFAFQGVTYTLPAISDTVPYSSLEAIPAAVTDQIRRYATELFNELIDEATQIVAQGISQAQQIAQETATTVATLATQADQQVSAIISEANNTAAQIRTDADQTAQAAIAAANGLYQQAQQQAAAAEQQFQADMTAIQQVATAAQTEAQTITSQAASAASAAVTTVVDGAEQVVSEAGTAITNAWHQFTDLF